MPVDDRISFYGIAIEEGAFEFKGIAIEEGAFEFKGLFIEADNMFNGKIQVVDNNENPIVGATVQLTSTQTLPQLYTGDITATTDSDGIVIITGSSTVGTSVTITHTDHHSVTTSLPGLKNGSISVTMPTKEIQRVKVTNRGNIMINPNDGILIELD